MTTPTQEKIILKAEARDVLGKQVRALRRVGIMPANVFGRDFESKAIKVDRIDFLHIFRKAGETSVVYVEVDGKTIPTLIADIQLHPLTRQIIHADLKKVDLKKKVEANVPIKIVGESVAVEQKNGVLLTQNDHITVEALPTAIPHEIEIDISALQEIGDDITVGKLTAGEGYVFIDEPDMVIVSVTEHVEESVEVQSATEAPEILTEKEGEEGAEGSEPAPEGSVKEVHKKND